MVMYPLASRVTAGCVNVTVGAPTRVMVYESMLPGKETEAVPE